MAERMLKCICKWRLFSVESELNKKCKDRVQFHWEEDKTQGKSHGALLAQVTHAKVHLYHHNVIQDSAEQAQDTTIWSPFVAKCT